MDKVIYRELLVRLLRPWERYGITRGRKVTYYGNRDEDRGPGWLHALFDPIEFAVQNEFFDRNPEFSNYNYRELLATVNGARLFSGMLDLHGLHLIDSDLTSFTDARIPFDLMRIHQEAEEYGVASDVFLFASSTFKGPALVFFESADGSIFSVSRDTKKKLQQWPSLEMFLKEKIESLSKDFDQDGNFVS